MAANEKTVGIVLAVGLVALVVYALYEKQQAAGLNASLAEAGTSTSNGGGLGDFLSSIGAGNITSALSSLTGAFSSTGQSNSLGLNSSDDNDPGLADADDDEYSNEPGFVDDSDTDDEDYD